MMRPLKIVHINVRSMDDREELCALCGSSLHMSKGEVKLLKYYAAQSSGFTPSVKRINEKTGLSRTQVYAVRNMLEKHGTVLVDQHCVYIDWERIRIFASLDPKLTGRHFNVAPVKKPDYNIYNIPESFLVKLQACTVEQACELLAGMPLPLYEKLKNRFAASATYQKGPKN